MLLQHVLQVPRAWLVAHDTDALDGAQVARFQALQSERLAGRPMAYLLGEREFMGRRFAVSPDVLIPRPETELLVEEALAFLAAGRVGADATSSNGRPLARVLDLGTGSGAIAVSIAAGCAHAQVSATDVSSSALALAECNARELGVTVRFLEGSWYEALDGCEPFDLIVSNPPYISANDGHLQQGDLRFEPTVALTDGADGLACIRGIVAGARAWLRPGGALWLEHGWDQAGQVRNLLTQAGFENVASRRDLAGIERISGGSL